MLIWSFFSLGALINVIFYDVLVLGISFDDALNYDPNYTIEAEYRGYSDAKVININFDDNQETRDDFSFNDDKEDEEPLPPVEPEVPSNPDTPNDPNQPWIYYK